MKTFFYPIFPSDFMKFRLLLVLLLLPLFWIGISNSHDWGDDYAQYLLQSKNLIENRPQTNSDLVFAEGQLPYAIIAYPVGFPALLAPVYSTFKLFIPPYLYLQTLILILSAVLLFDYLKRSFDIKLSLLIAIFYAYNIISQILKMEILSEFPFTLILLLIVLSLGSKDKRAFLFAGILSGFLMSFRVSGLVILPAVFGWILFMQKEIPIQKRLLNFGVFSSLAIAVFIILNCILFDIDIRNFVQFYSGQFEANRMRVPSNFVGFFEKIAAAFIPTFTSVIITILILILTITGFYKKFKEKEVAEWFFICYLLLIVLYPYSSSGLRFIYPVLPFILIYFVKGFQTFYHLLSSKDRSFSILTIIFSVSIILSYKVLNSLPPADGPYANDARAMLNFIRNETPADAIVLFSRARAINLYSERRSTFLIQHKNEQENLANLRALSCDYVLYPDERSGAFNQSLQDFLMINKSEFDTIYKENRYLLLKMKAVNHP